MSSSTNTQVDDGTVVYPNEPTGNGEGNIFPPDAFLFSTVEFILRNKFITSYEGENDRQGIRQFSPDKTNYTKGDEKFWKMVSDGKECIYFPYCICNVDECGGTKRGLCKEVNNGNVVMPSTRNELFAVLNKGRRLVHRFRMKEKKANMKPPPPSSMKLPPPSSSSSVGIITGPKNDSTDEMLETNVSMEELVEMKEGEKNIVLNDEDKGIEEDNKPKNIATDNIYITNVKKEQNKSQQQVIELLTDPCSPEVKKKILKKMTIQLQWRTKKKLTKSNNILF